MPQIYGSSKKTLGEVQKNNVQHCAMSRFVKYLSRFHLVSFGYVSFRTCCQIKRSFKLDLPADCDN